MLTNFPNASGTLRRTPKLYLYRSLYLKGIFIYAKFRCAECEPFQTRIAATSRQSGLSCSPQLRTKQRRHRGRLPSRREARIRDRLVTLTAGSLSHGTTAARRCRLIACVHTSPPTRSNCPGWHVRAHSSVRARFSSVLPIKCVLCSVTHCGPTLSRTPTRATRTPCEQCLPQADSSLRGALARRCVPAQLSR